MSALGGWNSECDYFGYYPTREQIEQQKEENESD